MKYTSAVILLVVIAITAIVGSTIERASTRALSTSNYNSPAYMVQDYTVVESDLAGNPAVGTLDHCKATCGNNLNCVGFTRRKRVDDIAVGECWYKSNIADAHVVNFDPDWHTYVKV